MDVRLCLTEAERFFFYWIKFSREEKQKMSLRNRAIEERFPPRSHPRWEKPTENICKVWRSKASSKQPLRLFLLCNWSGHVLTNRKRWSWSWSLSRRIWESWCCWSVWPSDLVRPEDGGRDCVTCVCVLVIYGNHSDHKPSANSPRTCGLKTLHSHSLQSSGSWGPVTQIPEKKRTVDLMRNQ